jgi:membrane-bound lytic murein transglycosylase A
MRPVPRLLRPFLLLLLFPTACTPPPTPTVPPPEVVVPAPVPPLEPVPWTSLEGWVEEDPRSALSAFNASCRSLRNRPGWRDVCDEAATVPAGDLAAVRTFFEGRFVPHKVRNPDGTDTGTITGYYVPDLRGSRKRTERFAYPLYRVPDDLLVIDLRSIYPELGNYRLRGRLEGNRVVPYHDRAGIDGEQQPLRGKEICWVEDPVELFFLHIQGSGRVTLEDGQIMVNYAEQNGHPYRSIGRLLLDRNEMTRDQMSMQNIKAWAERNPDRVGKLLFENPSYIFFRERPVGGEPEGAMGIALTARRSLAVDPRTIPLGAPVFLATDWPDRPEPLRRLMVAQDTGGAIKGAVRGDFYWGMGSDAGYYAGRMKNPGRLWVLLPVGMTPP